MLSVEIGKACKRFRKRRGLKQSDVARMTGYGVANISSFETGRNNNMIILLWYIYAGLTIAELKSVTGVFEYGAEKKR